MVQRGGISIMPQEWIFFKAKKMVRVNVKVAAVKHKTIMRKKPYIKTL